MAPKAPRKSTQANAKAPFVPPANAIPQPLPPSVEEAYRRKCCQLRHRYNQIEEHNDAARLRLHRLRRQLDKLRVERAFLLEQVSKRTSMNVEDSDGSPSPPPTPKEKPLRTKRGHRKASLVPDLDLSKSASGTALSQAANASPTSEGFSQGKPNGITKPKKPVDAFELYCQDKTDEIKEKNQDNEDFNLESELARGWKDLSDDDKEEFRAKYDEAVIQYQKDLEAYTAKKEKAEKASKKAAEADTQGADTEPEGDQDQDQDQDQDIDMEPKESADKAASPAADKEDDVEKKADEKKSPADQDEDMEETQNGDKAKPKDDEAEEEEPEEEPEARQEPASQDEDVEMGDDNDTDEKK